MNSVQKMIVVAIAVSLAVVFAAPASAADYWAQLSGGEEVPATTSTAYGLGCFSLQLNGINYYLNYQIWVVNLSAAETGAHIHGPALSGTNAGVLFTLPAGSPKIGQVGPLSAAEIADLNAVKWYVNIHSTNFPDGEIRGQILQNSGPCSVRVEEKTWGTIKVLYR